MNVVLTDEFALEGEELALDQAEAVKVRGVQLIDASPGPFSVDLAALERANSITIAVLVSWYRHARLHQKSIMFVNLSRELTNIVEFSGLSRILLPSER